MQTVKCLVQSAGFRIGECSPETIILGEGTTPNIKVFCPNHLDYLDDLHDFHRKEVEKLAGVLELGYSRSAGAFDRLVEKAKNQHQDYKKAKRDAELWLEISEDFEKQLKLVKKKLGEWKRLVVKLK